MKVKLCLLMILGFFSCTQKTEEQAELEEIVQVEEVGKKELLQGKKGQDLDLVPKILRIIFGFVRSSHQDGSFLRSVLLRVHRPDNNNGLQDLKPYKKPQDHASYCFPSRFGG